MEASNLYNKHQEIRIGRYHIQGKEKHFSLAILSKDGLVSF